MSVSERKFGSLPTGEEVKIYHLENKTGAYAEVCQYGGILVKLCVPDKDGKLRDVVLGYDELEPYFENGCFFGAIIGRNGNRIAGGKFSIYGKEVHLAQNENDNNLHSGPDGFEKKLWNVDEIAPEKNSIIFNRISPDGENGFPGEFDCSVKYELTEANELKIHYQGVSDAPTVANMTNHTYFNLNGEGSGSVLDQYLMIHAEEYTPVCDSHSIPVGVNAPVEGTPMDFRTAKKIGQDINADFEQLKFTGGYDHNFVTDNYAKGNIRLVATAFSKESGIAVDVSTDCPGIQFYPANFVNNEKGKNGHIYNPRSGFCLETQVEPNAVNVDNFHSPVIEAGEQYDSMTCYRFYIKD